MNPCTHWVSYTLPATTAAFFSCCQTCLDLSCVHTQLSMDIHLSCPNCCCCCRRRCSGKCFLQLQWSCWESSPCPISVYWQCSKLRAEAAVSHTLSARQISLDNLLSPSVVRYCLCKARKSMHVHSSTADQVAHLA